MDNPIPNCLAPRGPGVPKWILLHPVDAVAATKIAGAGALVPFPKESPSLYSGATQVSADYFVDADSRTTTLGIKAQHRGLRCNSKGHCQSHSPPRTITSLHPAQFCPPFALPMPSTQLPSLWKATLPTCICTYWGWQHGVSTTLLRLRAGGTTSAPVLQMCFMAVMFLVPYPLRGQVCRLPAMLPATPTHLNLTEPHATLHCCPKTSLHLHTAFIQDFQFFGGWHSSAGGGNTALKGRSSSCTGRHWLTGLPLLYSTLATPEQAVSAYCWLQNLPLN